MQIACPACQKQLRVPDSAAGKTVKCPACSKTFQAIAVVEEQIQSAPPKKAPKAPPVQDDVEDEAPRRRRELEEEDDERPRRRRDRDDDAAEEDDRPRRRRDRDDDDDIDARPRRKRGSGAGSITSVGVITIILGSLTLLCGVCVAIAGIGFAGGGGQGRFGGGNVLPFQAAGGILIAFAVLILVFGVVYLVGGIGVLQRRNWGRIMTLIAAGFSGLFGVLQIGGGVINLLGPAPMESKIGAFLVNLLVAFVCLAHCIMSFMVLLNSKNAREFE